MNRRRTEPEFPKTADVVIIGAGVIGASIAYQLAKRRVSAVVLEKGDPACGSSAACGGAIFLQSKSPGTHLKLALESAGYFPQLADELEVDIEYHQSGGMILIENEDQYRIIASSVEKQRAAGLQVDLLDTRQARTLEPALTEAVIGAAYCPTDAQVNPMRLTLALLHGARNLGARLFSRTAVVGLQQASGRVTAVKTVQGDIRTDVVVNAAGVYAPQIGEMAGVKVAIRPRRGQLMVTEAVSPLVGRCMLSAQYICAKFNPELAASGGGGISLEQTQNGNFVLGSTREFVGFDRGTTCAAMQAIAAQITRLIPALKYIRIIRVFAGLRPFTSHGLPNLGRISGLNGFIMAAGHEGDGITLSPITGKLIADLIVDGHADISLDEFRTQRSDS
jgi:glycine/D-amino acid oxidase-like deaminating enzyme